MKLFPCAVHVCCSKKPIYFYAEKAFDPDDKAVFGLCEKHHADFNKEKFVLADVTVRCFIFASVSRPPCFLQATRFYYDVVAQELFGYCGCHHHLHDGHTNLIPTNTEEWPVLDVMEA